MYNLVYKVYENSGIMTGNSADDVNDRLCTVLCNHYDDCEISNKIFDVRYRTDPVEYIRYEERADIVDSGGKRVGFYKIELI